MAKEYYSIVTKLGQAKIANASVYGTKVDITTIKLGDGNGEEYNPEETQTDLKRVVYTGPVGSVSTDPENENIIVVESIIPQEQGGFTIREIGYYDKDGDLIVVAKYKSQFKPVISSGATVDMKVNTLIAVSNSANVELKIDHTLIFATKRDVDIVNRKIGDIRLLKTKDKSNVVNSINELVDKNLEPKPVIISASKWIENIYSFEEEYPSNQYDIFLELSSECTEEIQSEWYRARILGGNLRENSIKALGIVPKLDIPVILDITKK